MAFQRNSERCGLSLFFTIFHDGLVHDKQTNNRAVNRGRAVQIFPFENNGLQSPIERSFRHVTLIYKQAYFMLMKQGEFRPNYPGF